MTRPLLVVAAMLGAGCGGPAAGPPHGPAHQPSNSPEASSPCPEEWREAKLAREKALDAPSAETREAAAEAVLAQGMCELRFFRGQAVAGGAREEMVARFGELRLLHQNTHNLFDEILNYGDARLNVAALTNLGDLHATYAMKLLAAPPPADVRDSGSRGRFRAELRDAAVVLEEDAAFSYRKALEAGMGISDSEIAQWIDAACEGLRRLDDDLWRTRPRCKP